MPQERKLTTSPITINVPAIPEPYNTATVVFPICFSSDSFPKNEIIIGIIGYTHGITQLRIAPPIANIIRLKIDRFSCPLVSSSSAELKTSLSDLGSPDSTIT